MVGSAAVDMHLDTFRMAIEEADSGTCHRSELRVEQGVESNNHLADLVLFLHASRDGFACVQYRSVIPASEGVPDLMQGGFGQAPSQIHGHLARECYVSSPPFTGHIRQPNIEMFGHLLLNLADGQTLP